jgi:hypothetical protein
MEMSVLFFECTGVSKQYFATDTDGNANQLAIQVKHQASRRLVSMVSTLYRFPRRCLGSHFYSPALWRYRQVSHPPPLSLSS